MVNEKQNDEDGFDMYVDELLFKGVPVEDYSRSELLTWYYSYCHKQESDELLDIEVILQEQVQDDVSNLMKSFTIILQRIERLEDRIHALEKAIARQAFK